jgi:hypothetical protein
VVGGIREHVDGNELVIMIFLSYLIFVVLVVVVVVAMKMITNFVLELLFGYTKRMLKEYYYYPVPFDIDWFDIHVTER